jgi:hypothetical protein
LAQFDVPGKNFAADHLLHHFPAMKLDTSHLRYLSDNDFRVLTAVQLSSPAISEDV